jgi:hypothetical protein
MPVNGIHGFISLNLNYGEITEEIIRLFLNHCECKYVFTGGAGGYIPHEENETKPAIGTRIAITRSMNEQGEIVTLGKIVQENEASAMHLQIPSIFLETYEWLEGAKQRGTSVDVETFYIIRAIHNYNLENPLTPVEADCGYFVSDYVGEQALREYSRVYREYPSILSEFLRKCFSLTDRSSN